MIQYTNSRDINYRSSARVDSTTLKVKKEKNVSTCRCYKRKSINALDGLLENRYFCRGVDRIAHEERCETRIQKIIKYYNRYRLSRFQAEVNIP